MMGPTMGSVTLQEEKGTAELTLHLVRTQREGHLQGSKGSPGMESASNLLLDFPASRTMRNIVCYLSHPDGGVSSWQPQQILFRQPSRHTRQHLLSRISLTESSASALQHQRVTQSASRLPFSPSHPPTSVLDIRVYRESSHM